MPAMSTTDVIAILALGVSIVAAVGTVGAWRAARHSHHAAAILSRIEEERQHAALTPSFRCQLAVTEDGASALLRLHLDGPAGLEPRGPIEVTVSIRNDSSWRGHASPVAGGPLPEEVRATVWGPWRFSADGCDDRGRAIAPQELLVGEWTQYALTPTMPPTWMTIGTERWRQDYADAPVRLRVTARSGSSVWNVPLEIAASPAAA
ncbi:hypothetical protein Snoj_32360 [Streptomyces nojiriensis]|uniref:Uncharacterized protein n=2 Tax=Streptomyces nojiriensis TaxID=66374 RepID=A0ABQ3SMF4_9ACTN|nr:hypothetical protein GCM10010205_74650 [Streptomyces nojiriensis]GHI69318.1 hypothetical protein Snoj_32360 [Streptomyces nojiriensis]